MLLAFETVARTASACVCEDHGAILEAADLGGAEAEIGLVAMLDRLIRAHPRIDTLAVATGPGSFTGLRIGVTAARTLGWLHGWPIRCVDALEARALEEGDGLWWVLASLKRDTTLHGLFAVANGRARALAPTAACADGEPPAPAALARGAIAIGPGLSAKPALVGRWSPGTPLGSAAALSALGVARAASSAEDAPWERCLPAYHQDPAPLIQRDAQRDAQRSAREH